MPAAGVPAGGRKDRTNETTSNLRWGVEWNSEFKGGLRRRAPRPSDGTPRSRLAPTNCMYALRREVSKARLEAFSDGVIAVAITLLALDLTVPQPGHGDLLTQLGAHWPQFAAYAVSFFTVGIIWVNHHARVMPHRRGRQDAALHQPRVAAVRGADPVRDRHDGDVSHQRRRGLAHCHGGVCGGARRHGAELHGDVRMVVG